MSSSLFFTAILHSLTFVCKKLVGNKNKKIHPPRSLFLTVSVHKIRRLSPSNHQKEMLKSLLHNCTFDILIICHGKSRKFVTCKHTTGACVHLKDQNQMKEPQIAERSFDFSTEKVILMPQSNNRWEMQRVVDKEKQI